MTPLGFVLEVTALGALAAAIASVVMRPAVSALARFPAVARADGALALATMPMLVAIVIMACVSAPSVLHLLGLRADHCQAHDHHLHLCAIHADALRPWLLAAGAGAASAFLARASALALRLASTDRTLRSLEALGQQEASAYPLVRVPGSPWVCHAAGAFRRRVLVSASLTSHLSRAQLHAAVAHEEAHLVRRDPLAALVMAVCSLFMLPGIAARLRSIFVDASEEASDAFAAGRHGASTVADALVAVARLQSGASQLAPAFGATAIERRVRILLRGVQRPRPPLAWRVAVLAGPAIVGTSALLADPLHHAVETLLHFV